MKQWEIIREAQENGAKITNKHWNGLWMKWDSENERWVNNHGRTDAFELSCNIELYIEPIKTFSASRAMYWLERGKMVKRKHWIGKCFFYRQEQKISLENDFTGYVTEWFHNDWHLCDEQGNYVPEPEEAE